MDYRERWELKEFQFEQRLERRMFLFAVVVAALLVSYALGFWYLQIVRGSTYAELAESNRLRKIPVFPVRGVIYDRTGTILASTRPSLRLLFHREGVQDPVEQIERLQSYLGDPAPALLQRLERYRRRPIFEPAVLKEDLRLEEIAPIEARRERFPAVEVEQSAKRTYPLGRVGSHTLGYVGEVSERDLSSPYGRGRLMAGDIVGRAGVERFYDAWLRGTPGWKYVTVNSVGRQLGEARPAERPVNGRDLHVSLHAELQTALEQALAGEAGAGVFLNVRTGEILALASSPGYDPNVLSGGLTPEHWEAIVRNPSRPLHNRAISSYYAPGSTFKVILAVAGLESGVISPSTTVTCHGWTRLHGQRFLCWKRGGHGRVNLEKALRESCNVYFYDLGVSLGLERIHEVAARFGLGRPTGVDLPGESSGILPSESWKMKTRGEIWYPGETVALSIGQGFLAVTPIQMARAMAAVAGRGRMPTPHVNLEGDWPAETVPANDSTWMVVQRALRRVVEDGTGRAAALQGIAVAGKTGTAQIHRQSSGVDPKDLPHHMRDHAWFAGYAPAGRPEVAFAVIVEHGGHGGESAAPVVRSVLKKYFELPESERKPRSRSAPGRVAQAAGEDGYAAASAAR